MLSQNFLPVQEIAMAILPAWLWDKDSSTATSFTCQEQNALGSIARHLENLAGFSGKGVVEYVAILESPGDSSRVSTAAGRGGHTLTRDQVQLQPKCQSSLATTEILVARHS